MQPKICLDSKKVALIRNVGWEDFGGGEIYQLMLAAELIKCGYEVIIVTSSRKLIKEAKLRGIRSVTPPYIRRQDWSGWKNILLPVYVVYQARLRRWYRKFYRDYGIGTINVQSRDDLIAAARAIKPRDNIKMIWTDHADLGSWVFVNLDKPFRNIIGRWILKYARKASAIIVVSEAERKKIEKKIFPRELKNMVVIRNGVIDEFEKYKNIKANRGSFCFVGRVVREKGIFELIEAFLKLNKDYPEATLNVYGDGEALKGCIVKARKCSGIKFYGMVRNVLPELARNSCFVLPSHKEGLSLSLVEAAMMRKAIIASDIDSNKEVINDGKDGLIVHVGDIDDLWKAMAYIIDCGEDARKFSLNAREAYEAKFNFADIVKKEILPLIS